MNILGVDPGPKDSAYVVWEPGRIVTHDTIRNAELLDVIRAHRECLVAIEWITGYGLTVGAETFDTCRWAGRFEQAAGGAILIPRREIKLALCGTVQAKDQHVRQALIDRIGEPGTKKRPGPTFGIASHEWAALACAVVCMDRAEREGR
jgi:hypothetical protein